MAPFDYLSERLDDQIKWYDRKSKNAKRWHFSMMVVQLVAATSIPVLAAAGAKPHQLDTGTFSQQGKDVIVCFDLPRGTSRLVLE